MSPSISIIVVAYREREALSECLNACLRAAASVPGGAELIVVDNGDLSALVADRFPQARLIAPKTNTGFAGGVNLGLAAARGRWAALVNDDARVEVEALGALLAAGDAHHQVGSVAAQVRFASSPDRVNSAGIDVDSLGVASERLAGRAISEAKLGCEVFGASASCALYRSTMLAQVGGLEERFFAYLEDVDLAWRARAAGWRAVYEPRAVAYHRGSASSGSASAGKYFLVGRNRVWLLARNATSRQLLRGLAGILAYDLAYVVFVAFTDLTLAPLRGRLAGLRHWRRLRFERYQQRREVDLSPAYRGWLAALRQHLAYRRMAVR